MVVNSGMIDDDETIVKKRLEDLEDKQNIDLASCKSDGEKDAEERDLERGGLEKVSELSLQA